MCQLLCLSNKSSGLAYKLSGILSHERRSLNVKLCHVRLLWQPVKMISCRTCVLCVWHYFFHLLCSLPPVREAWKLPVSRLPRNINSQVMLSVEMQGCNMHLRWTLWRVALVKVVAMATLSLGAAFFFLFLMGGSRKPKAGQLSEQWERGRWICVSHGLGLRKMKKKKVTAALD